MGYRVMLGELDDPQTYELARVQQAKAVGALSGVMISGLAQSEQRKAVYSIQYSVGNPGLMKW